MCFDFYASVTVRSKIGRSGHVFAALSRNKAVMDISLCVPPGQERVTVSPLVIDNQPERVKVVALLRVTEVAWYFVPLIVIQNPSGSAMVKSVPPLWATVTVTLSAAAL